MSKLEIIPGWELIKRISEGSMKKGDQYRRLNSKYAVSFFEVGECEGGKELRPSTDSFIKDKFIVLKLEYSNCEEAKKEIAIDAESERKNEALRIAASYATKEQFEKSLIEYKDSCPSDYGLMDYCGQSCKKCIKQALAECTVTFVND